MQVFAQVFVQVSAHWVSARWVDTLGHMDAPSFPCGTPGPEQAHALKRSRPENGVVRLLRLDPDLSLTLSVPVVGCAPHPLSGLDIK